MILQLDFDPRVEAFWRVGGFYATERDKKLRKEKEVPECMIEDPIDRFFQYFGEPILQLRSKNPLELIPKITSSTTELETTAEDLHNAEVTADAKSTQLVEKTENEVNVLNKKNGEQYPWQEYRYSPDLYLEIPRERYHGAIVPGQYKSVRSTYGLDLNFLMELGKIVLQVSGQMIRFDLEFYRIIALVIA